MPLTVKQILKKSPAKKAGIRKDDIIHRINNIEMYDFIDDIYVNTLTNPIVEVERNGVFTGINVKKDEYEDIGIIYEENLFPHEKSCTNKCLFCFVDQLPKGMRTSLCVRDDDWRYSVLYGNYITMTNMSKDDFFRIASRKVSPLYISVHATDSLVREKLMRNKNAGKIMEQLKFLHNKGITFHSQVVLCPSINDGKVLEKTIMDLAELYPYAKSLSVVPVGLTKHREGLPKLTAVDINYAKNSIKLIDKYRNKLISKIGVPFIYAADEFYSKAEMEYPRYYGDDISSQKANGVGLFSDFLDEFDIALQQLEGYNAKSRHVIVVTGLSAYGQIKIMSRQIEDIVLNLTVEVIKVDNRLFGNSITVSGLLVGKDIITALTNREADAILIPESTLKSDENIFLDNISVNELKQRLKKYVIISPADGYEFAMNIVGRKVK